MNTTPYTKGAAAPTATPTTPTPDVDEHHSDAADASDAGPLFAQAKASRVLPNLRGQCAKVLAWLVEAREAMARGEKPEPVTAAFMFVRGVGRPQSRINNLREAGHDIRTDTITVTKADGTEARVASYVLVALASER